VQIGAELPCKGAKVRGRDTSSGLGSRQSGAWYGSSGSGTGAGPEPVPAPEHLNPGPDGRDPGPENEQSELKGGSIGKPDSWLGVQKVGARRCRDRGIGRTRRRRVPTRCNSGHLPPENESRQLGQHAVLTLPSESSESARITQGELMVTITDAAGGVGVIEVEHRALTESPVPAETEMGQIGRDRT
jgi:hypothetical protein